MNLCEQSINRENKMLLNSSKLKILRLRLSSDIENVPLETLKPGQTLLLTISDLRLPLKSNKAILKLEKLDRIVTIKFSLEVKSIRDVKLLALTVNY